MGALGLFAPPLALRVAERLFFTPTRMPSRRKDDAAVAAGRKAHIPYHLHLSGRVWGRGPTILLVHGWSGRGSQLIRFVGPLVRAGFQVVSIDMPGHGRSAARPAHSSSSATRFRRRAHVRSGARRHRARMGGAAVTLALAEGLEVERAVLVAPPAHLADQSRRFAQTIGIPSGVLGALEQRLEARFGVRLDDIRVERFADRIDHEDYSERHQLLRRGPGSRNEQ